MKNKTFYSNKRDGVFIDKEDYYKSLVLNFIANKDEIIKNQLKLNTKDINDLVKFNELVNEMYGDNYLQVFTLNGNGSEYNTVLKIEDRNNLSSNLLDFFYELIKGDFTVEVEQLAFPTTLSFHNEKVKYYMINYDMAVVNI